MVNSEDYIVAQLKEQNIEFNFILKGLSLDKDYLINQTVNKWKNKFIVNNSAPCLDDYLWHIFSYGHTKSIQEENATKEYLNQWKTKVLIFNESKKYLFECFNSIPKIEMNGFVDDIYISHSNMKWTYVIPHEIPEMGPYFSIG